MDWNPYINNTIIVAFMHKRVFKTAFLIILFLVSIAYADGSGILNRSRSYSLCGFYVAAGVGMQTLGYGNITITGIPATATIVEAFLYYSVKTIGAPGPTHGNGIFDGNPITGTNIGFDDDPCWAPSPANRATTFRADVTSYVYGNGSYRLTGFYNEYIGTDDIGIDGASIVIIYDNPTGTPCYDIVLFDGNVLLAPILAGGVEVYNVIITGFTATSTVTLAQLTDIAGNGQSIGTQTTSFNGTVIAANHYNGSDGVMWDTDTWNVTGLISPGDTSATFQTTSLWYIFGQDCISLVAVVLGIRSDSCPPCIPTTLTNTPTLTPTNTPTLTPTLTLTLTPTSTPTATPTDCYTPPDFFEGFEAGLTRWDFLVWGSIAYLQSNIFSAEGLYSLQIGPSGCPVGCYWDQMIRMHHKFAEKYPNGRISFWIKSLNHFGGKIHVFLNTSVYIGEWTPCDEWSFIEFHYYDEITDIDFFFIDIPESNAVFIDKIQLTSDCHGLATPTPTLPCGFISFSSDPEDFEAGLTDWDFKTEGAVPYSINTGYAHDGSHSFRVGPSSCSRCCYGSYSMTLIKKFPGSREGAKVSFWLKNSFHIGGITQVFGYHPSYGTFLMGTCLPSTSWTYYSFIYLGPIDEIRFYFVDVTDLNNIYLDSVDILTGECTSYSKVPVGNTSLEIILGIFIILLLIPLRKHYHWR
ncbi:MAG: hypothetical protein A2161_09845 [Candidatus Schekmanbacteria bacterium RBG_13_48_7]|uniref:DUF3344 domain-containing protein n=1 Tax=Candidatus Schekmanbacteria bacterium RBG_13_48_7 TaxID=1817878 RepID=A0A1F7RYA4_9BACT|nr:MAG: hypothetical protein A2161_09845 [Candidatus Schekmanbacteria bacterium RBG_13_48_7]